MKLEITAFYCLYDDFLIFEDWLDNRQSAMSTAEVMTAAPTAFMSLSAGTSAYGTAKYIRTNASDDVFQAGRNIFTD